jgi:hypothetical protein
MILVTTVKQIVTLFVVALVIGIVASAALATHARNSPRWHGRVNSTLKTNCPAPRAPARQARAAGG